MILAVSCASLVLSSAVLIAIITKQKVRHYMSYDVKRIHADIFLVPSSHRREHHNYCYGILCGGLAMV